MRKYLAQKNRKKRGFTLMEVMVVVGIIAVAAAIAIPSVISMRKNMDFRQRNDYAKTIFLAAQSNLVELRSTGGLSAMQDNKTKAVVQSEDQVANADSTGNLPEKFTEKYVYTYHDPNAASVLGTPAAYFDAVLPVNAVESVIRDQQVVIEYNPKTGGVYSVFYGEDFDLAGQYQKGALQRDEEWRKKNLVGYYDGSDMTSVELGIFEVDQTRLAFENGQEAIVHIDIPTQVKEADGSLSNIFGDESSYYSRYVNGLEIKLTVTGETQGMFTKTIKAAGEDTTYTVVDGNPNMIRISVPLDSLAPGGSFAGLAENQVTAPADGQNRNITEIANESAFRVLPGDNVSLMAELSYASGGNDPLISFENAVLAGVNPMFASLTINSDNSYILAVSNGRNLQNLNALAPSIAEKVKTVAVVPQNQEEQTDPSTQAQKPGNIDWAETVAYYTDKYGTFTNTETAARALPYFVPINNPYLFGAASLNGSDLTEVNVGTIRKVTSITTFAELDGNDSVIRNLNIAAEKADTVTASYYTVAGELFTATGREFTGMFRYMNGTVSNLRIANPVIRGGETAAAVGALTGAAGSSANITGVYVYADTGAADFSWGSLNVNNFEGVDGEYGVSGYGAVGGVAGYSKGAVFTGSFGAVPVYGTMNQTANGVGGFVGVARGGSFNKCYASIPVTGKEGSKEKGTGGFVGTSFGSDYTSCFATGNVRGGSYLHTGGFVGVMDNVLGEEISRFSSCYAVGIVIANDYYANFTGGNVISSTTNMYNADYYKAYVKSYPKGAWPTNYVYKDCYFLSGYDNVKNRDDYVEPVGYNFLIELNEQYVVNAWSLAEGWTEVKNSNEKDDLKVAFTGSRNGEHGYLASEFVTTTWTNPTPETHSYNPKIKYSYPLEMLSGMPFYGVWTTAYSNVGLAYYEEYSNNSEGLYFDREATATLRNDLAVKADGYAIVSAGKITKYTINGTEYTVVEADQKTVTIGSSKYNIYKIPATQLANLSTASFYTKVSVTTSAGTTEAYFNPNVAISQIRGEDYSEGELPEQVLIRTARQLAALGTDAMKPYWNLNYVQQRSLDFTNYGNGEQKVNTIGTGETPFNGKYSGSGQVYIIGADKPIFGTIAGTVENLVISPKTVDTDNTVTITGEDSIGLLAVENRGFITNVLVQPSSNKLSLSATTNAGLLVGINHGSIDKGIVYVHGGEQEVTLSAANVGLVAGQAVDSTIKNSSANGRVLYLPRTSTFGGIVGSATNSTLTDNAVSFTGVKEKPYAAAMAGGLAGKLAGCKVTGISATFDTAVFTGNVGGVAGWAGNCDADGTQTEIKEADVTIKTSLSGLEVGGLLWRADNFPNANKETNAFASVTITDGRVVLGGNLVGAAPAAEAGADNTDAVTTRAAGAVVYAGGGCTINKVTVTGSGAISGSEAAGFAIENAGTINEGVVAPTATGENLKHTNNSALRITGSKLSAGFAITNTGTGNISKARVLGTVYGAALVHTNSNRVALSSAYVDQPSGGAFVNGGAGTVVNCYGWTNGGSTAVSCNCQNSYFVSMNGAGTVTLYDGTGTKYLDNAELESLSAALDKLDGGQGVWSVGGTYSAYPYTEDLSGMNYPYPMFRNHYGDWILSKADYSYGVMYYEQYEDNTWGVAKHTLSGRNKAEMPYTTGGAVAGLKNGEKVKQAGYALYCVDGINPFADTTKALMGQQISDKKLNDAANLAEMYCFYQLKTDGVGLAGVNISDGANSINVKACFANAINYTGTTFEIRFQNHLKNVKMAPSGTYRITASFDLEGNTGIETFSGKLTAEAVSTITVINGTSSLVGKLQGGELRNIALAGNMSLSGVSGALVNTMESGTLAGCTVSAAITGDGDNVGLIAGHVAGGNISNCHSTGNNSSLGFVGSIVEGEPAAVTGNPTHFSTTRYESGKIDKFEVEKNFTAITGAPMKRTYAAVISDDCTYVKNGKTNYAMTAENYYYTVTGQDKYSYSQEPVLKFIQQTGRTLASFGMEAADWKQTGYYVTHEELYYPVYVKVEVKTETVNESGSASETDGTETGNHEDTPTSAPTEPATVTTYTYSFGYPKGNGEYQSIYTKQTRNPNGEGIDSIKLYMISGLPTNGTYILINSNTQALAANATEGTSHAPLSNGVTTDMIWAAGADGKWTNVEFSGNAITVALPAPEGGSNGLLPVSVNGASYYLYQVSVDTTRDVARVDMDAVCSTTKPGAEAPAATDPTVATES